MGLGGYLMWTAVARELFKRTGLKCLPIETHGAAIRMIHSPVFYNNIHFIQPSEKFEYAFPLVLNDPVTNYCKEDTPSKATHRYDRHIIEQYCEPFGIQNPEIKCELYLSESEKMFLDDFRLSFGNDKYVVIEPHTKDEYTVNKTYPFEKWQAVVDEISKYRKVVQVGQKTDKVLKGCTDLTGGTSFREAAAIISDSELFIGPEGGLMHVANAVNVKSVVVITGFIHPRMTCYRENINLWIGKPHGPCGLKTECEKCKSECNEHNPCVIVDLVKKELGIS